MFEFDFERFVMGEQFTGSWRSYKSFYHNGSVQKHNQSSYREITLGSNAELTFRTIGKFSNSKTLLNDAWDIQEWDSRRFLFLEGKKTFEIITFDATDIVLVDAVTAEKTFYISLPQWNDRLEPAHQPDENVYLTIWSPSLINRITITE